MTRSIYTTAADYIRTLAGCGPEGTRLSRADSSRIAEQLSLYMLSHEKEITARAVGDFIQAVPFYSRGS
jgi:hypothetical protein